MVKHKTFCKGLFCRKEDRKLNCIDCGVRICDVCSIPEGKKTYCPNCYVKSFSPNWDKLNKEWEEMITDLFHKKKDTKDENIVRS